MLNKEEKEAIEFAYSELSEVVKILEKRNEKEKANFNAGVVFALEWFFEFDESGKCLGLEEATIHEYLARKYLAKAKKLNRP